MPIPKHLLAIGLPHAGKTTYLAAFWHVVESKEIQEALTVRVISDEAKHLNEIRNDWLLCKPAVRTGMEAEKMVTLCLDNIDEKKIGNVVFPDLSGETFQQTQWKDRHWTPEYQQLVENADSLLLFINAGKVNEPWSIRDIQRMVVAAGIDDDENATPDNCLNNENLNYQNSSSHSEWDPEKVPTQVQLVGLLQFIQPYIRERAPIRVSVVISAWDLENGDLSPVEWLEKRLPYLYQFLYSNIEYFTFQVYGVSAQGGNFSNEPDRKRLLSYSIASERILITGPNCAQHDITEPIKWALCLRDQ